MERICSGKATKAVRPGCAERIAPIPGRRLHTAEIFASIAENKQRQ